MATMISVDVIGRVTKSAETFIRSVAMIAERGGNGGRGGNRRHRRTEEQDLVAAAGANGAGANAAGTATAAPQPRRCRFDGIPLAAISSPTAAARRLSPP